MSLLSKLLGRPRRDEEDHEWKNSELGLYFSPRPNDRVWKAVTPRIAEIAQQGFLEIHRRVGLDKYTSTNALPDEVTDVFCEVANAVGEKNNLNPSFMLLLAHQYVDADQVMRQMYRSRWVAFMVKRDQCAPPPESYMSYLQEKYFGGG